MVQRSQRKFVCKKKKNIKKKEKEMIKNVHEKIMARHRTNYCFKGCRGFFFRSLQTSWDDNHLTGLNYKLKKGYAKYPSSS